MKIYCRKINLKYLNSSLLNSLFSGKGRYDIVSDLVEKCKVEDFIGLSNSNFKNLGYKEKIEIYLSVVFFKCGREVLPVFSFLEFDILKNKNIINSCKGIMFSTYIHDLDRDALCDCSLRFNSLSLDLWNSLFKKEFEKDFIFVFPESKTKVSRTEVYMRNLEFDLIKLNNGKYRIFFMEKSPVDQVIVMDAVKSISDVILDMMKGKGITSFNFKKLNDLKEIQKNRFIYWLSFYKRDVCFKPKPRSFTNLVKS